MQRDPRSQFGRAAALHREGRLDEAITLYRMAARASPGVFEVERLLALALLQSGRLKEAHAVARKSRDRHRANPHAYLLMGAVLQAEAKWDRAFEAFRKAATLDPGLAEAAYLSGTALARMGRLEEAAASHDRALAIDPALDEARANRAALLARLGRPGDALADCELLLERHPHDPRHHLGRAGALMALARPAEALASAQAALERVPKHADAHLLKGQALLALGDLAGGRDAIVQASLLAPGEPAISIALMGCERALGNLEAARALGEGVAARGHASAGLWRELVEVRRALGDGEGALDAANLALAVDPRAPAVLAAKARLLNDAGRPEEARRLADAALALDPDLPMARWLRSVDDLAEGRWQPGWEGYESRAALQPPPYRPLPFARWDGGAAPRELVVLGEGGIGDMIQFGRLVRLLADRGVATRLLVPPRHVPLLSRLDARVPVAGDLAGLDLDAAGLCWTPLASLPRLLSPDPALWPRPPYLTADPARVARWAGMFADRFTVGICWRADADGEADPGRSIPLDLFAPLAALDGVELVSLQGESGDAELDASLFGGRIARLGPGWDGEGTFVDTAALLQHIDLVVTCDASLAHLAGARGREALVALKAGADWRWGRAAEESVFYPSLRLVRQETPGDFAAVVMHIARRVAERRREPAVRVSGGIR